MDVPSWIGWDKLMQYYRKCPSDVHKKVFCFLFETGGRVSEVITLKRRQFRHNEYSVVVDKMPVFKYRLRKGVRKNVTRDVFIRRDRLNPLAEDLIDFVDECGTSFIFPRRTSLTSEIVPGKHTSRVRIYNLTTEISKDLFPHWFRSMRASFLVYVRRFNIFELKQWFAWKSMDTPGSYVRGVELAEKLGIQELPQTPKEILQPLSSVVKEKSIRERLAELEQRYERGEIK